MTDVALAVVRRGRRYLICLRRPDAPLGSLWEFPGGKMEPGEGAEACALRELLEEVGVRARSVCVWPAVEYWYPTFSVRLHPVLCQYVSGKAQALESQALEWVEPEALSGYEFPPATAPILARIVALEWEGNG